MKEYNISEIARKYNVSERTIRTYFQAMKSKGEKIIIRSDLSSKIERWFKEEKK